MKKILADTQSKIDGTINPSKRKIFLYSAHEGNIATLLLSLDAYKITDIPPYGSYVLIELHTINGVNGIKVNFQFLN